LATGGEDGHRCDFLLVRLDGESLSKDGVYVTWSENTGDTDGTVV